MRTPLFCFIIFYVLRLSSVMLSVTEYIYPVGCVRNNTQEIVLVIQQEEGQPVLYRLDPTHMVYEKILSSHYVPSAVTLLPDNSGFSFIDDGRIRIKHFLKRAVQTLDVFEPIYAIGGLQWISSDKCIFHAREGDHYGIYSMNIEGDIERILCDEHSDYLYPNYCNDAVYYIAHTHGIYSINRIAYAACNAQSDVLVLATKQPMMFLRMISAREGFYIEPPQDMHLRRLITFGFYHVMQNSIGEWQRQKLFDFVVPNELLFNDEIRLYESILPLIPIYFDESVYYNSAGESCDNMRTYRYDMLSKTSEKFYSKGDAHCFGIIPVRHGFLIGGKSLHNIAYAGSN